MSDERCSPSRRLKIAIVGAGPSGLFAAEELNLQLGDDVEVDVFERLPTPYGLVRYGVAPDHPTIKSVVTSLQAVLEAGNVRFIGNVAIGCDLLIEDLMRCYDAVVYASGAPAARKLGIPGEDLPGSHSANELVNWYNGHPDSTSDIALHAEAIAVLGAGNVALDLARILTRGIDELADTDIPAPVLEALGDSAVRDVHVVARRAPQFAKFSTKELRELARVAGVRRVVRPDELADPTQGGFDRATAGRLALFHEWASEEHREGGRAVHFRFALRPVEITGTTRVEGVVLERTVASDDGRCVGTGTFVTIPVQMVVRAVGYHGSPLHGVPFDEGTGTVPNCAGRVLGSVGGDVQPGQYVTGWLKRGPVGVIGTNKSDSRETIRLLLEDCRDRHRPPKESIDSTLTESGHSWIPYDGWLNIDREEIARGALDGRARAKIRDRRTLIEVGTAPVSAMRGSETR